MFSRIQHFLRDRESISKYNRAIALLKEARVDLVLLELSAAEPVEVNSPQATQTAAFQHFERLGYQKCLADLFSLTEININKTAPVADFGATDKLLSEGILTEEQAQSILKEI